MRRALILDLAIYLLAAVEARREAIDAALELLTRAIRLSPEAGQQARYDPDFDSLHDSEQFWRLTDKKLASTGTMPASARKVRRRGERLFLESRVSGPAIGR